MIRRNFPAGWTIRCPSLTSYGADDEEVPRVPGHSKARQQYLARQYSGHDALPADCKFRWQPIAAELRITTSDPPYLATQSPSDSTTRVQALVPGLRRSENRLL